MESETELLKERIKGLEIENSILKEQQIEVNQAKELYLKIFEDFPALIWRARLDKLCDYFNRTWLDFTGRTMEQEFGNGWTEGVHPDDFDYCLKIFITAFDNRESFEMDYRLKNKFGKYCWIKDFGRPFYDLNNEFLGYIGSCYDITEKKEAEILIFQQNEELKKLNNDKDQIISILAHDLKSPFYTLLGFTRLLSKNIHKYDNERIVNYSNQIHESAENTFHLLEDLLLWARAQSDKFVLDRQNLDLKEISNEIIEILMPSAKSKQITLNNHISEEVPVFADKNMVKTIIRNLISNAIKFTDTNGQIDIYTKQNEAEITITISDNGIGIDHNNIANLFNKSQIFTTTGTDDEKGTGLGLVLCKEFVEEHGGKIWVESLEEKGCKFNFTLFQK